MAVTLAGMLTLSSAAQPENAFFGITVTSPGILTSLRAAQPENTPSPSVLTLSGILIASSAQQPEKRLFFNSFRPLGRTALLSFEQFENAPSPTAFTASDMLTLSTPDAVNADFSISVTVSGTVYAPVFPTGQLMSSVLPALNSTPSAEAYASFPSSTANASSAVQPEKALRSSFFTVSEMLTFLSAVQPVNAPLPTPVTPLFITTSIIMSLCFFQGTDVPSFASSGSSPLPLIVKTPLRASDQERPASVPSASTSESFAPQTLQVPSPLSPCAALSLTLPHQLHSCQCSLPLLSHAEPLSQLCRIFSMSMPEVSPPIAVQRSFVPSNITLSIFVPLKALSPMRSTPVGILSSSTAAQDAKASLPMVLTPSGMLVTAREEHPLNAFSPMAVTLCGIFTSVRPAQSSNRLSDSSVSF